MRGEVRDERGEVEISKGKSLPVCFLYLDEVEVSFFLLPGSIELIRMVNKRQLLVCFLDVVHCYVVWIKSQDLAILFKSWRSPPLNRGALVLKGRRKEKKRKEKKRKEKKRKEKKRKEKKRKEKKRKEREKKRNKREQNIRTEEIDLTSGMTRDTIEKDEEKQSKEDEEEIKSKYLRWRRVEVKRMNSFNTSR